MSKLSLAVEIAGLKLRNPLMLSSGILGITAPLLRRVYESGAGAVVTKSIGPKPRLGHPNPTVVTLECGLLNAMGLPNPGVDEFSEELRSLKGLGIPVIASVFGERVEDYAEVARKLSDAGADAIEINCSCPTVREIGLLKVLGQDSAVIEEVTRAVKRAVKAPVFAKLTPNVTDITEIAQATERGGADGITAINTLKAMAVDIETYRPVLANVTGGLSGPAVKPVALRCVWEIAETVKIPIIGCGGVSDWRDAVEFLLCGASAVQVGTAIMHHGTEVFSSIASGIKAYLRRKGFRSVEEIVGRSHRTL